MKGKPSCGPRRVGVRDAIKARLENPESRSGAYSGAISQEGGGSDEVNPQSLDGVEGMEQGQVHGASGIR